MSSYLAASASDGSRAYAMYVSVFFFSSKSSSVPSPGGDLESLQNIVLRVLFKKKRLANPENHYKSRRNIRDRDNEKRIKRACGSYL